MHHPVQVVGWNVDVPFIGPARIRGRELHVNASADRREQYAIAAKPAQSRGVSHEQLRFPPS